jgi:hypothetical protein
MIVYATLPIVKIVPASSDFVRVSWPSPSPGYKLKGTYELVSQNWFTITNAPLEFAGEYRLYLPKDVPKLFFRLAYE